MGLLTNHIRSFHVNSFSDISDWSKYQLVKKIAELGCLSKRSQTITAEKNRIDQHKFKAAICWFMLVHDGQYDASQAGLTSML